MNRERAKELLPVMESYSKGGTVQFRSRPDLRWTDIASPDFSGDHGEYRIKPEPHDIKWAVQQMRDGHTVRRSSWSNTTFRLKMTSLGHVTEHTGVEFWRSHVNDFTADDWEIYEPK